MKREKLETVSKKKTKETVSVKIYLRNFILFVNKHLMKTIGILFVVALLLLAVSFKFVSSTIFEEQDAIGVFANYWSKLQVIFVTALAGIVPYIYAPVVGFTGCVISEVSNLTYAIKFHGYLVGTLAYIVPLVLNLLVISVVTALGIYICKAITIGYRVSNIKNMNWLNFRIKLYETLQKQSKVDELTKHKDKKIKKLESKKEKINYLQILNTSIVVCIIQFISVLIQHIVL